MVAVKFIGLFVTFYTLIVLQAYGENFYPARYGKRDENDAYRSKDLLENRRVGRGESQDSLSRKMGFFISGGRFGKRGCSDNCYEGDVSTGSKEVIDEGYHNRQDRSERIRIPIRKNQFMIGSRFGKRKEGQTDYIENVSGRTVRCNFVSVSDLFKCLERKDLDDGDRIESNSMSDLLQ